MSRAFASWGGRVGFVFLVTAAWALPVAAVDVLFPAPRHFVRRITDGVSNSVTTVREYCDGNRVAAISGDRVVITDYGKQEILEIDRSAGTYSITHFDELARLNAGRKPHGSRDTITVAVKRSPDAMLSRAAAEVLIGAAYPNERGSVHEEILRETRVRRRIGSEAASSDEDLHALPLEHTVTIRAAGEEVSIRTEILAVTSERAPPDALLIPPGARRVESHASRFARELRVLEP